jgi:hypothetical protein
VAHCTTLTAATAVALAAAITLAASSLALAIIVALVLRLSPATSFIYILYIRPLQSSLKDFISYIYFLSNNVL